MSRFVASLLLLLISFPVISPALADLDSDIPVCCRKAGKHACELAGHRHHASGPQLAADPCGHFAASRAVPASEKFGGQVLAVQSYLTMVASPAARQAQTHALYRISYSRAGQKRGPPSLLA